MQTRETISIAKNCFDLEDFDRLFFSSETGLTLNNFSCYFSFIHQTRLWSEQHTIPMIKLSWLFKTCINLFTLSDTSSE